ncbi:MAG: hypothetical protein R3B99_29720 [Polyangiales bacterium]
MNRLAFVFGTLALAGCPSSSNPDPDSGESPDAALPDSAVETAPDAEVAPDASMPDAGPPPRMACDEEGATRIASCGACGNAQERCTGGFWEQASECLNQRTCVPGSLDEEVAELCQSRRRLCLDSCEWGEWDYAGEPGECEPGETGDDGSCGPGQITRQTCNDTCMWETECESPCGPLRTTPAELAEVCVPGGLFYRGDPEFDRPFTEVHVSTFASAVHPVTTRRLFECRAAGACPERLSAFEEETLSSNDPLFPAMVNRQAAMELCEWDGGRLLMTSAQWEKAQRGPLPNRRLWANAEIEYACDLLPAYDCPGVEPGSLPAPIRVGEAPGSRGFYGVEHQMLTRASMRDNYGPDYESTPESLVDPVGPAVAHRGWSVSRGVGNRNQLRSRIGSWSNAGDGYGAIYCVREIR